MGIRSSVTRSWQLWRSPMPRNPLHSDTYIVEFPKSGVTWLSTMLANAALIQSGRCEVATFASSGLYVPDIHVSRNLAEPVFSTPPCRLIKSHATYTPVYKFVIYLARHPVEVMQSYHNFIGGRVDGPVGDPYAFIRSRKWGVQKWKNHVRSWIFRNRDPARILVIRYEDLLDDPVSQITHISTAFGWNLGSASVERAISLSSASRMAENEEMFRHRRVSARTRFVRSDSKKSLPDAAKRYIHSVCSEEMAMLGYEPT
jgi:hypothetical protein